jgi:hypothetical protein
VKAKRAVKLVLTKGEVDSLRWLLRAHMTRYGQKVSDWRKADSVWTSIYDEALRAKKEAK